MASNAIATITRMMESLPEALQNQIVEHLREYIAELEDELRWEFSSTGRKSNSSRLLARQNRKSPKEKPSQWIWIGYEISNIIGKNT